MSGYTMTQAEVKYAYYNVGTQLNTFTAEASLQGTYPLCVIPQKYFNVTGELSKSLKIKAGGRLGTTGAPTFTWSVRAIPTANSWSAGGILLGATAALTAGTTQTLAPWFLEADVGLRTLAPGAASTLVAAGEVRSPLGLASPFAGTIPANNTSLTTATYDDSLWYSIWLSAACGTSNVANLIQLEYLKVYCEN
jgi:hypothetical protein